MQAPVEYLVFKITVLKRCLFIVLFACAVSLIFKQKGFSFGFLVGGLVSMAIFSLLYKYVLAVKDFSAQKRKKYLIPKALLIYVIMATALFIAITKGLAVFLGTAAGLLSLKLAIFAEAFKKIAPR